MLTPEEVLKLYTQVQTGSVPGDCVNAWRHAREALIALVLALHAHRERWPEDFPSPLVEPDTLREAFERLPRG